ncbi:hypothetical protein [Curtobacterium sp. ISL-83]|uniref:hypothetical protein n=1 Tax=Curtobacterium sp. ISL-83 TaxID=2819145 RepID=UPI001BE84DA9|nr:hypothetical protein [Curtobacterium sp. ISL-83]MBT2501148.1 hypothetical protein [Curtobacterium sp. ISL-83]
MSDDDVTAERARLEAVAWGADVDPADAARARIALQDLAAGRRRSPTRRRDGAGLPTAAGGGRGVGGRTGGAASSPGSVLPGGLAAREAGRGGPEVAPGGEPRLPSGATAQADPQDRPQDGAGPSAPEGPQSFGARMRGLLWRQRPRVWIACGAAAALGVAFAAGTVVGTARPGMQPMASITPTAGTVTLEQLLDAPQTYADQLPGPVEAAVSLHSTRLVFTNRALDGGSLNTPWNVWAGVGKDRSTICLIATANRLESTSACYPREQALHGSVSLSAQSLSGTLTILLRGGAVQGTVTTTP